MNLERPARPAEQLNEYLERLIKDTPSAHPDISHMRRVLQHNLAYTESASRHLAIGKFEQREIKRLSIREKQIIVANVLPVVSEVFGFPVNEIIGQKRKHDLILARMASSYFFVFLGELGQVTTGEKLGGRDHSTISYHISRVPALMDELEDFANLMREAETKLREKAASSRSL